MDWPLTAAEVDKTFAEPGATVGKQAAGWWFGSPQLHFYSQLFTPLLHQARRRED